MIQDCGFGTVMVVAPPNLPNRGFYVCLPKGWQRPNPKRASA